MGLIADVTAGNPVSATWGNSIRSASVMQVLASEVASISANEGQLIYVTDEDRFYTYSGAAWVRVGWGSTTTGRTGTTVRRNATQSIGTGGTSTAISFDVEDFDSDGFITPTATDVTIPTGLAGLYAVWFNVYWASDPGASSICRARLTFAGPTYGISTGDATSAIRNNFGGSTTLMGGGFVLPLDAGDKVGVSVYQASGGAINATAKMTVYRIGV